MVPSDSSHTKRLCLVSLGSSPVSQPGDVRVQLSGDALQYGVPEALSLHQSTVQAVHYGQHHAVLWLVQLPAIHLVIQSGSSRQD